jgi:hypothetical protein
MTSEVAVIRQETLALEPLCRVDPPPRSSPPMRMTASWCDPLRSTEYKAVARDQRNTNGELASDFHRRLQLAVSHVTSNVCRPKPTHPAVVLAAVKDAARR